jgi:hypothetical protein
MGEYIHKWKLACFQNALFQEFNDKENPFYHGNEWMINQEAQKPQNESFSC